MSKRLFLFLAAIIVCSSSLFAESQAGVIVRWTVDGSTVCEVLGSQTKPVAAPGNAGSVIIAWEDARNSATDIYAQRMDKDGNKLWAADGREIAILGSHSAPQILTDGAGGAFIVWSDARGGSAQLYAQRVNENGAVQWTANGINICSVSGANPDKYQLISNNTGGFIVVWQDQRNTTNDIFAQRVNADGSMPWGATGKAVFVSDNEQTDPKTAADGNSGAIIVWTDSSDMKLYARRLNADGELQWGTTVQICAEGGDQPGASIISDGNGGAIIAWQDYRSGSEYDIYAQRLNGSGSLLWDAAGKAVCTTSTNPEYPVMISDGANGAIIAWNTYEGGGTLQNILVQKVDSTGAVKWNTDGVALTSASAGMPFGNQKIISDGLNGAIVTWDDSANYGVYAQRVNASGLGQWGAQAATACSADCYSYAPCIVSDGTGGAVIAWSDQRDTDDNIVAQRLTNLPPEIVSVTPSSAAQGATVNVTLYGKWFYLQPVLSLSGAGITVNSVTFSSETLLTANLTVAADATPGARDLTITNTNGSSATVSNAFTIIPPPEIISVIPSSAMQGETVMITISGKRFLPQPVLSLSGAGITVNEVTFSSETLLTANLTLAADATPGARNLTLTNTNGSSVTTANIFTVAAAVVEPSTPTVTTSTTTAIVPEATATISVTLPSGNAVTLDIAPNTFAGGVNLTMAAAASIPASTDASLTTTALGLDITNDLGLQPLRDITITMHYRHTDLGALDESKLVIALFDTTRNRWVPIPSQVYPDLDEVVGRVAHLTTFALVQLAPADDLAGVRAYPIPFNPAGGALTIDRLTADAEIKLFTVAGEPVRQLAPVSVNGTLSWDGKNDNGSTVASGVYLALIKSGAGTRKIKIAVER